MSERKHWDATRIIEEPQLEKPPTQKVIMLGKPVNRMLDNLCVNLREARKEVLETYAAWFAVKCRDADLEEAYRKAANKYDEAALALATYLVDLDGYKYPDLG